MPMTGVPDAAAICSGPVSPEIISAAALISDTRSVTVVVWRSGRRAVGSGRNVLRELFFTRPPQHKRSQAMALGEASCNLRKIHGRPAFVRPRGPWIDEREVARLRGYRGASRFVRNGRIAILERKLDVRHANADCLQHRQILVDDMRRRVAGRFRIEETRGPFAQEVRRKPDDARSAG